MGGRRIRHRRPIAGSDSCHYYIHYSRGLNLERVDQPGTPGLWYGL